MERFAITLKSKLWAVYQMKITWIVLGIFLSGCGAAYISPSVSEQAEGTKVRVVNLTPETVLIANKSNYRPKQLPAVFYQTAGAGGGLRGAGALPQPAFEPQTRPATVETRLPPSIPERPYRIGVGDVLVLATRQAGSTVEELSGLLAAQNRRQGYTVQDDGAIAIPDVGRIPLAGKTLEEAETIVFQQLVENQIDPTFSLEIAEFNSKKVSVGGAVKNPTIEPITLTPLYLNEALAKAGGVDAPDRKYVVLRLYRDGKLYQLPLKMLPNIRVRLKDGDRIFVDTDYKLDQAQAYFEEQIKLAEFRQNSRILALNELNAEISLRRASLEESRSNFKSRMDLDAVDRDYVYLVGEVKNQSRFPLPFGHKATVADALYSEGGALTEFANPSQIYILRGSPNPADFGAVTAWHINASNAVNFLLATKMELRPNDIIFIAEQPITRWGRVVKQIVPSLITAGIGAAAN